MDLLEHKNNIPRGILMSSKERVHFWYLRAVSPKHTEEDKSRREFILNIILLSSIVLLLWSDTFILISSLKHETETNHISFEIFTWILVVFVFLYGLSRRGHITIPSYILTAIFFLGTAYGTYRWGISLPSALLSYALVISMASILIGSRAGLIVVTASILVLLTVGIPQAHRGIVHEWQLHNIRILDVVQYSMFLLFITVLSWLSTKEIEKSLRRARSSEKALKEKNESLEEIVEERTRELKKTQLEKISQMYRFVEFGRLSSGVFHDLLNPLSVVRANVEHLRSNINSEIPDITESINDAVTASKRMEQFFGTLRKQVQTQENRSQFFLNQEIEDCLLLFEYKAKKQNVIIEFEAVQEIPFEGNRLKFHQIIANLVSNAVDSFDPITDDRERLVSISLSENNHKITISVADNGSGIDPAHFSNIFDPFFTTKSEHNGIGIGLSSSKNLIEKDFHGSITASNNLHQGSIFIISLPLHESKTSASTVTKNNRQRT